MIGVGGGRFSKDCFRDDLMTRATPNQNGTPNFGKPPFGGPLSKPKKEMVENRMENHMADEVGTGLRYGPIGIVIYCLFS